MAHLIGEGEVIAHAIDELQGGGVEHPLAGPIDRARCGVAAIDRVEELLGQGFVRVVEILREISRHMVGET